MEILLHLTPNTWGATLALSAAGAMCGYLSSGLVEALPRRIMLSADSSGCQYGAVPVSHGLLAAAISAFCAVALVISVRLFGLGAQGAGAFAFATVLLLCALIDLRTMLLPDVLTLPLLWAGLLLSSISGPVPADQSVLGAAFGYALPWCVGQTGKLFGGRDVLGAGDYKLSSALGAWLGVLTMPYVILGAALAALAAAAAAHLAGILRRDARMPFGPYLAGAGLAALIATWPSLPTVG